MTAVLNAAYNDAAGVTAQFNLNILTRMNRELGGIQGHAGSIAVLAVAERGAMFDPSAVFYMEKLAVGPEAADVIDLTAPVAENIRRVAKAKHVGVGDVTVCVLDRARHESLVKEIRRTGARIHFVSDGDVAGAISAARPGTGVDMLYGIGGTPEGVIAAAALKCMGGAIQGRLWPQDDEERARALAAGHDLDQVSPPTSWCAATTCSSAPPGSPTATCCAACTTGAAAAPPSRS